jgi:SAM-dependent methyltransferase
MVTHTIHAALVGVAPNTAPLEERNFAARWAMRDELELHALGGQTEPAETEALLRALDAVDTALFRRLRAELRQGLHRGAGFAELIEQYVGADPAHRLALNEPGYDALDLFVNGLLLAREAPREAALSESELVRYHQTPVRVVFELLERAGLNSDDTLYDLGAGLGHVPLLANLLSGAAACGVELNPAFCAYAASIAEALGLHEARFVHADARLLDYAPGVVYFLYTPFTGRALQTVLERLAAAARRGPLRLFAYGPCTATVARQAWLRPLDDAEHDSQRLAGFSNDR